ncbi:hypothetical protein PV08_09176 [Exophiala spinifera]|uniref:tRNA(Phe) (4-demethylwyosine(37)-C(7)) aminocarboxypropyltransferase n=1 Tax=Exophiala spinifera TaxID=91928 RepID=A0A0D2AYX0_9EURO|nr:uncharacterized protein PV08_09176 [Exophiala spinifera]KIW11903.1 hypothetical protein PV08_09176 [Exophiala spinifera]
MAQGYRPERKGRQKRPANPLVRGVLAFCQKFGITVLDSTNSDIHTVTATAAADVRDSTGPRPGTGLAIGSENEEQPPNPSSLDLTPSVSLNDIPKRYTSYPPLLLLPHNFPAHNERWTAVYSALSGGDRNVLFQCIAETGFAGQNISRIAINAPIAAAAQEDGHGHSHSHDPDTGVDREEQPQLHQHRKKENFMRSPSGLVPVYGDWGGTTPLRSHSALSTSSISNVPTPQDFSNAFWTSTSQHRGITQCWAPLYTMFSRGNVAEKARILGTTPTAGGNSSGGARPRDGDSSGSGNGSVTFPGLTSEELREPLPETDVMDFYVGIGYFAFCYLTRGVRRVYGWDINPWSIEGLRRGCEANGWTCLVIRVDDHGNMVDQTAADVAKRINGHDHGQGQGQGQDPTGHEMQSEVTVRCVAFLGDNKWADKVMREITTAGVALNIRHANLGLLPTSRGSWENAVKAIVCGSGRSNNKNKSVERGGWLHVHENVDVREIEKIKTQITHDIDGLVKRQVSEHESERELAWAVSCDHVEQVKTYAPGVMHCVYDVHINPINPNG